MNTPTNESNIAIKKEELRVAKRKLVELRMQKMNEKEHEAVKFVSSLAQDARRSMPYTMQDVNVSHSLRGNADDLKAIEIELDKVNFLVKALSL